MREPTSQSAVPVPITSRVVTKGVELSRRSCAIWWWTPPAKHTAQ
ncbi:MAG: hypothetical protein M5U28_56530 [Sandaracinaceae bacterium]|nr:hypothetical protein [Sandaracinaceae bacterium]